MTYYITARFPEYRGSVPALLTLSSSAGDPRGLRDLSPDELDDVACAGLGGAALGGVIGGAIGYGLSRWKYGQADTAMVAICTPAGAALGGILSGVV
jgi:hypothetical protein